MDKFYLTTHRPHWLETVDVNLCVARHHLQGRRTMPRARRGWALDSRGFMELRLNGEWTMTPEEYVALTLRCDNEIGLLEWAAPMDWMFTHPSDTCRSSWSTMSILITSWMGELWLLSCHCQAGGPWGSTTSGGRGLRSRTSFRGWVTC